MDSGNGAQRGVIRNRGFANQVKDYSGLCYGKITPTDIDGLIDFGNKAFVIIEVKRLDAIIPDGQKLAIERLADTIILSGKPCLVLIARHDTEGDIDVANCLVTEYRSNGAWTETTTDPTVKRFVDWFLERMGLYPLYSKTSSESQ